jgi:hypothetical protein|tara:strand:- start:7 stop:237 length:231 start_codon:yes stop_codon:yes gene_type:complete
MNDLTRKLPFDCQVIDQGPVEVANPYTGETCSLVPDAVAVYDTIKGAELFKQYDLVRKGLDWFREHEPKAYMVLLD